MAKASAFDVRSLRKSRWKDWKDLASWLSQEIDLCHGARSTRKADLADAWGYYEQARMRAGRMPWPDAADLPSPYAAEYTDAIHARLMQTIFVEPLWTVEGYGTSAVKAPIVEEFHQKAQEDERLQGFLDEWILRGLVEGVGILETTENRTWRREQVTKTVALQLDEVGNPILGPQGPMLARDEAGGFVPVDDPTTPSAVAQMDEWTPARLGPAYEVVPYLDFLVLPAHARHQGHIWGYAKRFWRRWPELEQWADRGWYGSTEVDLVGDANDKAITSDDIPASGISVVDQRGHTSQKELYECSLLLDLDGQGERWYVITLHKESTTILRCKVDDGLTRYTRWMPFPKPGTADHGYSLVGNKLITVIEQDTSLRNLTMDRMAMKASQPVLRQQNALWQPFVEPMGPRAVIDVRDMNEIRMLQGIEDVPQSIQVERRATRDDADRLIGQNDVSIGAETSTDRTLGEVQLRAGYAEVRINVLVKRMQEALEELGQVRHTIWLNTLRNNPTLPPQRAMVIGQTAAGISVPGYPPDIRVTAEILDGVYWFKPRGSVETADLNRQQQWTIQLLQTLGPLAQMNPAIGMILQTIPAAKSIMEQVIRVFRWPDRQSLLGDEAGGVFEQIQAQQEQQRMQQQAMLDPRMQFIMGLAGGGGPPQVPMPTPQSEPQGQPPSGMVA